MRDLAVLVPAYNEVKNLKKIIKYKDKYNIFIIDDCSTDGTHSFLIINKLRFIRNKTNIGYERSLIKGFKYLIKKNYKYIFTIDGDGEHPINSIKRIYLKAKSANADLVICNRKTKNRYLEIILSFLFFIRYKIRDPLSGMKLYSSKKLKKVLKKIDYNDFLVDVIVLFKKRNFKILNYNIITQKKIGYSKIGSAFAIQIKILRLLKFIF